MRRLLRWGEANHRDFPWRDPRTSDYEVLVAELLLKRTTSAAAARVYPSFVEDYPSIAVLAETPAEYLENSLRPIGLYKQRAAGMRQLAEYVRDHHESILPRDVDSLERLPHTGPYAARAVVSFAQGRRAAIVDSNVVRILGRLFRDFLPDRPSATEFQRIADALLPSKRHREFNYALLDLGATVCRYVRPKCASCPLNQVCDSKKA